MKDCHAAPELRRAHRRRSRPREQRLGGHAGGELASRVATALVAASFTGSSLDELTTAVRAANWAVWERGASTAELDGMATTLCAAGLVEDGVPAVVHVGDTRAYLARSGSLHRPTEDHTVTAELVRDGQVTEALARRRQRRRQTSPSSSPMCALDLGPCSGYHGRRGEPCGN